MTSETPEGKSSGCSLLLITAFLVAVVSIYGLLAADEMRVFMKGESTTARVEECTGGRKPNCTGTWVLSDGTTVSGTVVGPGRDAVGRSIEVRALDGTATTSGAGDVWFKVIAISTTMILLVGLFVLAWRRRR
ncbi:hypothetical protein BKA00_006161 [Actinomadura coerulea]|uniref:Uncharacterized protein n=1 Tax=Actinomadura coerulea TaxID=46159 RepID=A0A7X0G5U3_9ACTN|nr:hypothetical protein [Actinomadura coerulea]MBB6399247.1 hypothetical protein [Actinomadura coerulea]GGQ24380.1 hypothetical protein GCM10010187_46220 [Actinomadura coerulea]